MIKDRNDDDHTISHSNDNNTMITLLRGLLGIGYQRRFLEKIKLNLAVTPSVQRSKSSCCCFILFVFVAPFV